MNLETVEIKAFVPVRHFELSKKFHRDNGILVTGLLRADRA
jgi:hypothetical protein